MECSLASVFAYYGSPRSKESHWAGRYYIPNRTVLSVLVGSILAQHWQHSLSMVPNKVSRASTEVWTATSRLWSSITRMAPGGRELGVFQVSWWAGDIKFLPSKGNYPNKIISSPFNICKVSF